MIGPVEARARQPFPLSEKCLEETAETRMKELKIMQKTISDVYPDVKIEKETAKASVH